MLSVWVVGQFLGVHAEGVVWQLEGIFTSADEARALALTDRSYFFGEAPIGVSFGKPMLTWAVEYPALAAGER